MTQPKHIGEILAKSQPGLSQAWSEKVTKTCLCGENFDGFVWHMPDGRIMDPKLCHECCRKEAQEQEQSRLQLELKSAIESVKALWVKSSNIPTKYSADSFDNFEQSWQPKAYKAVKEFNWNEGFGDSLVLLSPGVYGVGKTHLVCALMNEIIRTDVKAFMENGMIKKYRCPFYFTTENALLRRIRETFNHKNEAETEEDVYQNLAKANLLILDDVGKVRPRDLTFIQGVYFNIIDQRYSDGQPIILTTNLDYGELEAHIGGACADRLIEMVGKSGFIKMTGKSYRQK